jgi:hypothetical protein
MLAVMFLVKLAVLFPVMFFWARVAFLVTLTVELVVMFAETLTVLLEVALTEMLAVLLAATETFF